MAVSSERPIGQPGRRPNKYDAGWSSPVAREAHNLEVAGSNPVPAIRLAVLAHGRPASRFRSRALLRSPPLLSSFLPFFDSPMAFAFAKLSDYEALRNRSL
jgi:hypothetical protein